MSDEQFFEELRAQNDYLRKQLTALNQGPAKRRVKFVEHAVYCAGCDDLLVEIIRLHPYRIVRYRRADRTDHRLDPGWQFHPISNDEPRPGKRLHVSDSLWSIDGAAVEHIRAVCRCSQHEFTLPEILDRGRRSSSHPTRKD